VPYPQSLPTSHADPLACFSGFGQAPPAAAVSLANVLFSALLGFTASGAFLDSDGPRLKAIRGWLTADPTFYEAPSRESRVTILGPADLFFFFFQQTSSSRQSTSLAGGRGTFPGRETPGEAGRTPVRDWIGTLPGSVPGPGPALSAVTLVGTQPRVIWPAASFSACLTGLGTPLLLGRSGCHWARATPFQRVLVTTREDYLLVSSPRVNRGRLEAFPGMEELDCRKSLLFLAAQNRY